MLSRLSRRDRLGKKKRGDGPPSTKVVMVLYNQNPLRNGDLRARNGKKKNREPPLEAFFDQGWNRGFSK